jgi:hypothetical protein
MRRVHSDQDKLFQIAAACQEAIQAQHQRESRQGYGLDDYTEGRIVGTASFARRIMRLISGGQLDAPTQRVQPRKPIGR